MNQPVKVSDLKDQTGLPFPRPILFCPYCGQEVSAHAGDYFMARKSHFTCCNEPMKLVVKRTQFDEVAA